MKTLPLLIQSAAILAPVAALAVDIPASVPGDPGSGNNPGFIVRSAQGPLDSALPVVLNRGIFQLNGTLRDPSGTPYENEAIPGPGPNGTYPIDTVINFEQTAVSEAEGPITNFPENALFPGIPGENGHTTNFTTEVFTFLELPAGEHTFGVQVWIGRTDAPGGGDDDVLAVFSASNPRDFFATKLGEAVRSPDAPAFSEIPDDTEFTFTAPVEGLYPFRLVYVNKTGGAGLEWYSVDPTTQDRILINDPDDERSIKAFQASTAAHHNHPYIAEARPQPGSSGIPADAPIEILLVDDGAFVNQNSIELLLNGNDITDEATITNADGRTSIVYQPNPARTELNNDIELTYLDTAGREFVREWTFEISAGLGVTQVTGQWDFDDGTLAATAGRDLEYLSTLAMTNTRFGTTTEFGIEDINGEVGDVMCVPEDVDKDIGYVMYHGLKPNGGGTRVNQYTLLMDVMISPDGAASAAGIIQVDSPRPTGDEPIPNSGDSDYFWQGNNMGQGQGGYNGTGIFTPGEWHRIVFAVDLAGDPPIVVKYIDGAKQDDWVQNGIDQPRRALLAPGDNEDHHYAILFTDGDDGEQRGWYVNSVQIREGKMTDVEIEELGGPSAEGFPRPDSFDNPNFTSRRRNIYGDLGVITEPETRRIVVRNTGESETLVIDSVTATGPDQQFFTVTGFPAMLESAEEGTIDVTFDPQGQSGSFEAVLEVASNDPGNPITTIDVTARVKNPAGLIAHYRMDETEGDAMLDASGQRYHGTYGSAGSGSFELGQGGLADGTSVRFSDGGAEIDGGGFGQLSADAGIPTLQSLTISMWAEPDANDIGASMLLAKGTAAGDPFAVATNVVGATGPVLWFVAEAEVIVTDPVLNTGQTHHIVVTHHDANGLEPGATRSRVYVDGTLVDELEDGPGYQDLAPSVIQIGALNGGFGFTGLIDDVQIYDRELSETEVQQLFANPGETITEPPVSTDTNILVNGSFEEPAVGNINTNNLGTVPVGWSQTGSDDTWNVIRNDGTPYGSGVDTAAHGSQILDLVGIFEIFQNFTLTQTSIVTFGASFANREAHDGSDASTVGIYDAGGTTLLSPLVTVDTSADPIPSEEWRSGEGTANLPAGEYQIRIALNNFNNVDAVYVRVSPGFSPHLVGYWPADEGEGTVIGNPVNPALNGTLNGGSWTADGGGQSGAAGDYAFEVTGEAGGISHVEVPATGKSFEQITIAGWVNGVQTGDWTGLIMARGGVAPDQPIGIGYRADTGNLTYVWNDDAAETWDFQSNLPIPGDEWAFVALTVTPDGATLYVGADGVLNSVVNAIPHIAQLNENTPWFFGKDNEDLRNFDGLMDDIAIWDLALSEAELLTLFEETETPLTLMPEGIVEPPVEALPPITDVGDVDGGGIGFTLPDGLTLDVEYSEDLINWEVIGEDVMGAFEDTDPVRTSQSEGYYRGRQ